MILGEMMTQNQLLMTIIILSSCFFIGSLIFQQGRCVLTGLFRGIAGMVVIGLTNIIFGSFGIFAPVGMNLVNFAWNSGNRCPVWHWILADISLTYICGKEREVTNFDKTLCCMDKYIVISSRKKLKAFEGLVASKALQSRNSCI